MNLYQKLIEIRKSVPFLEKDEHGEKFKYVSSSQALGALRSEMDNQGVLLKPEVMSVDVRFLDRGPDKVDAIFTELRVKFTWINAEEPTEILESEWYGQGIDYGSERGVGKAFTYAEKYFLLKFFNIATDKDDPDADQKEKTGKQRPSGRQTGSGEDKKITEGQVRLVWAKIYRKYDDKEQATQALREIISKRYGIESTKDMTQRHLNDFLEFVETIQKQEQGELL